MQQNNNQRVISFQQGLADLRRKYREGTSVNELAHELIGLDTLVDSDLIDPDSPSYNKDFAAIFDTAVQYFDLEHTIEEYLKAAKR